MKADDHFSLSVVVDVFDGLHVPLWTDPEVEVERLVTCGKTEEEIQLHDTQEEQTPWITTHINSDFILIREWMEIIRVLTP